MAEKEADGLKRSLDEARSLLRFALEATKNDAEADAETREKIGAAIGRYFVDFPLEFAKAEEERGPGFLYIGLTPAMTQVVVDLGRDRTGHIVFTPAEAHQLAETLTRKAFEAEANRV